MRWREVEREVGDRKRKYALTYEQTSGENARDPPGKHTIEYTYKY